MQPSSIRAALVRLGIVIAALFFTAPSQAVPLVLEAGASSGGLSLAGHLEMLHDPSGQLTQAEVASDEYAGQFTPLRVADRTRELQAEIERRQQTQVQLQKAMHEQRNFLSMVTHEFRTPLSTIGASAEMIGDERLPRSAQDTLREAAKISRA